MQDTLQTILQNTTTHIYRTVQYSSADFSFGSGWGYGHEEKLEQPREFSFRAPHNYVFVYDYYVVLRLSCCLENKLPL